MTGLMIPAFPKRLEIELVSTCNLRCTYCPRHYLDNLKGFMDTELFSKIIGEAEIYPETILVLHRRGESMLHPRFRDILLSISGKFREVQLATNATLLTPDTFEAIISGLTFISFSIDVPDVFNKTRVPATYEKVEDNILRFLDYNKNRVKTQVSMVRTAETPENNCVLFQNIWEKKVDRVRIYEEHSIGGKFGAMNTPRRTRKACTMPFYEMLIYSDGAVGRCNHDWAGSPMGNVNERSITDIWHSDQYANLREQHRSLAIDDEVCAHCDSWYPEEGVQGTGKVFDKHG